MNFSNFNPVKFSKDKRQFLNFEICLHKIASQIIFRSDEEI